MAFAFSTSSGQPAFKYPPTLSQNPPRLSENIFDVPKQNLLEYYYVAKRLYFSDEFPEHLQNSHTSLLAQTAKRSAEDMRDDDEDDLYAEMEPQPKIAKIEIPNTESAKVEVAQVEPMDITLSTPMDISVPNPGNLTKTLPPPTAAILKPTLPTLPTTPPISAAATASSLRRTSTPQPPHGQESSIPGLRLATQTPPPMATKPIVTPKTPPSPFSSPSKSMTNIITPKAQRPAISQSSAPTSSKLQNTPLPISKPVVKTSTSRKLPVLSDKRAELQRLIKAPPADFSEVSTLECIREFAAEEGYARTDRIKVVQQLLAVAKGMRRPKVIEALEAAKGRIEGS